MNAMSYIHSGLRQALAMVVSSPRCFAVVFQMKSGANEAQITNCGVRSARRLRISLADSLSRMKNWGRNKLAIKTSLGASIKQTESVFVQWHHMGSVVIQFAHQATREVAMPFRNALPLRR